MHKEEVELFLNRAKNFLDGAKARYQKEDAEEALKIAIEIEYLVKNIRHYDINK